MSRRTGAAGAIGIAAAAIGLLAGAVGRRRGDHRRDGAARRHPAHDASPRTSASSRSTSRAARSCSRHPTRRGMPGRYGFWFDRDSGHARLGDVVDEDDRFVRRATRLASTSAASSAPTAAASAAGTTWARGSSAYPYENVVVETAARPGPAWLVPGRRRRRRRWVIQVHGRGATRRGPARGPIFHDAGWNTLLVSYRNDGEAPESEDRRYGLGATEWPTSMAAVAVRASDRGAERIVLMGWSMGGAIVLQAVLRSAASATARRASSSSRRSSTGCDILGFQGAGARLPSGLGDGVVRLLGGPWSGGLTGLAAPITFDASTGRARRRVRRADPAPAQRRRRIRADRRLASTSPSPGPTSSSSRCSRARATRSCGTTTRSAGPRLVRGWLERSAVDVHRLGDEAEIAG